MMMMMMMMMMTMLMTMTMMMMMMMMVMPATTTMMNEHLADDKEERDEREQRRAEGVAKGGGGGKGYYSARGVQPLEASHAAVGGNDEVDPVGFGVVADGLSGARRPSLSEEPLAEDLLHGELQLLQGQGRRGAIPPQLRGAAARTRRIQEPSFARVENSTVPRGSGRCAHRGGRSSPRLTWTASGQPARREETDHRGAGGVRWPREGASLLCVRPALFPREGGAIKGRTTCREGVGFDVGEGGGLGVAVGARDHDVLRHRVVLQGRLADRDDVELVRLLAHQVRERPAQHCLRVLGGVVGKADLPRCLGALLLRLCGDGLGDREGLHAVLAHHQDRAVAVVHHVVAHAPEADEGEDAPLQGAHSPAAQDDQIDLSGVGVLGYRRGDARRTSRGRERVRVRMAPKLEVHCNDELRSPLEGVCGNHLVAPLLRLPLARDGVHRPCRRDGRGFKREARANAHQFPTFRPPAGRCFACPCTRGTVCVSCRARGWAHTHCVRTSMCK